MDKVAYIIENQKNQFKGFIAMLTPDENDAALFVIHSTDKSENLQEIQEKLKELPEDIKTFPNPIKSSENGLSWLSELESVNP
jgi:hypothetical protein